MQRGAVSGLPTAHGGGRGVFFLACWAWYSVEPAFQQDDRGAEVIVEGHQQVDVVEVFLAAEAVGEVVAWD